MKKPKAPVIQESAAEKSLRANGNAMAAEAASITDRLGARATKAALADTSNIDTSAASAAVARSAGKALNQATDTDSRVAAILGTNSAKAEAVNKARTTSFAQRLQTMDSVAKRGLGITGGAMRSLSTLADGQAQAAAITAESKMQRQAEKMRAVGSVISTGANYFANQAFMKELKGIPTSAKPGDMSADPNSFNLLDKFKGGF